MAVSQIADADGARRVVVRACGGRPIDRVGAPGPGRSLVADPPADIRGASRIRTGDRAAFETPSPPAAAPAPLQRAPAP